MTAIPYKIMVFIFQFNTTPFDRKKESPEASTSLLYSMDNEQNRIYQSQN